MGNIGLARCIFSFVVVCATSYDDKMDLMQFRSTSGELRPVNSVADWNTRRAHILENMQAVMGPIPDFSGTALDIEYEESVRFDTYTRHKIRYTAEPGDQVSAYLLVPHDIEEPVPGILCLHPTSAFGKSMVVGLGDKPNRNYAQELAERGYVTLAPDYPGFGDYHPDVYEMGYASATAKGIVNHRRALDLLATLPDVDADRLAAIGHSLGGHNALFAAAFDVRIKAVVTSCGFNRFAKYYGGDLTGWSHRGYMPRIADRYGKDPARMPFDFTEILGALAPRPIFISAPLHDANFEVSGVRDCVTAARPVYDLYGAPDSLQAVHPDCEHDFPPHVRNDAYAFLDSVLGQD